MFTSLRSRLWISYALLILAALGVVAFTFIVFLFRNPYVYRETIQELHAVQAVIVQNHKDLAVLSQNDLITLAADLDHTFDVRVIVIEENKTLADSRGGSLSALRLPERHEIRESRVGLSFPDESGNSWIISASRLKNERILLLAMPRPNVPLGLIFRDELFPPLIRGALFGLFLALVLAYLMARWVADPLQKLVAASQSFPEKEPELLPQNGPHEVKELTQAFNAMTARVRASQAAQREFVANVSHELKTPLTSIHGFAQAIGDDTAASIEEKHNAASIIYNESARMHRMVLGLLDLARIDSGTFDFKMAEMDLPALLRGVAERFSLQAKRAGVEIMVNAPASTIIQADGDHLAQVFTNLVDNALKYTPANGSISLIQKEAGDWVEITVEDNGAGIPAESQARIFDRFYQVDAARTGGEHHGAGLGLAIAREIVLAHGGKISVQSEPSKGTAFTIRLPRKASTNALNSFNNRPMLQ
jgi:signal transduction histidine kinase